jgi:zinc D-Ala-D-Ala carboxypeptidase
MARLTFANFRQADTPDWSRRWPNFSPRELACKGTGQLVVDTEALDKLQALRNRLGRPLLITSAYRSPEHNRRVGGAPNSLHMRAVAFDVRMENQNPASFDIAARETGFTGFGYYPRQGFMHIDTGPARIWGEPFPRTATGQPAETIEAARPAQSTTVQAAAVQVVSSGAAAGFGITQLEGNAQVVAVVFAGIILLAAAWIMRERIRRMFAGD